MQIVPNRFAAGISQTRRDQSRCRPVLLEAWTVIRQRHSCSLCFALSLHRVHSSTFSPGTLWKVNYHYMFALLDSSWSIWWMSLLAAVWLVDETWVYHLACSDHLLKIWECRENISDMQKFNNEMLTLVNSPVYPAIGKIWFWHLEMYAHLQLSRQPVSFTHMSILPKCHCSTKPEHCDIC